MIAILVLASLLAGAAAGAMLGARFLREPPASPRGFLAEIVGSPPHWSVDHLADRVAAAIAKVEGKRAEEAIAAVRACRVRFVDHPFLAHDPDRPAPQGELAAAYYDGRIVIQDGDGWERRLAWALCQQARIALHGMPEPQADHEADFAAAGIVAREVEHGADV